MARKLPVKTKVIALSGDYEGWHFTARTNPPLGLILELQERGGVQELMTFLQAVVLDWDFVDESGEPLGPPSRETLKRLPSDLLLEMFSQYNKEVMALSPKPAEPSSPPPG